MTKIGYYALLVTSMVFLLYVDRQDLSGKNDWLMFYWWLLIFTTLGVYALMKIPKALSQKIKTVCQQDALILIAILLFALITRFFLITRYPHIAIGDELRDAGLNAVKIKTGIITDLFGFGDYQGYGNFIPLIASFFIPFFGISPLIYRVPSALLSIGAIAFTYLIGRLLAGRKEGVIASLFLTGSLLHLHYSRTELVVIADSFLSPLMIAAVYISFFSAEGFLLAGLVMGLALHFYAGIRGIMAASLIYLVIVYAVKMAAAIINKKKPRLIAYSQTIVIGSLLFLIGLFIGLGPTINRIQSDNTFNNVGTATLIFRDQNFQQKTLFDKIDTLFHLYEQSFLTYTFAPTRDFHFAYYQQRQRESLLVSPLSWFFLIGLGYLFLVKKNLLTQLVITILLIFPVVNEVLVNSVGMNHRLMAIMPLLMVVAAMGLIKFSEQISAQTIRKFFLIAVVLFYLTTQLYLFFGKRVSDAGFDQKEYLFQNILEYIKKDRVSENYYILSDKPYDFDPLHYAEKVAFFTNPKKVNLIHRDEFVNGVKKKDRQSTDAFITIEPPKDLEGYQKKLTRQRCAVRSILPNYNCPPNSTGDLRFYVF